MSLPDEQKDQNSFSKPPDDEIHGSTDNPQTMETDASINDHRFQDEDDVPSQPISIYKPTRPKSLSSLSDAVRRWRIRRASSRLPKSANTGPQNSAITTNNNDAQISSPPITSTTSDAHSTLTLSTRTSQVLDVAQRWLGRTRKQKITRFTLLIFLILLICFLINAFLAILGIFLTYRSIANSLVVKSVNINDLCSDTSQLFLQFDINGGWLMSFYDISLNEPLEANIEALLSPASQEYKKLAFIKVPPLHIGRTSGTQTVTINKIEFNLNEDIPTLAKLVINQYLNGGLMDSSLTIKANLRLKVSTTSFLIPLSKQWDNYEYSVTFPLKKFFEKTENVSFSSMNSMKSYMDIISLEFLDDPNPNKIELVIHLLYQKILPPFVKINLPALQFDLFGLEQTESTQKSLATYPPFASICTDAHLLNGNKENTFDVRLLVTDQHPDVSKFLKQLGRDPSKLIIRISGSKSLPVSKCKLQRLIQEIDVPIPISKLKVLNSTTSPQLPAIPSFHQSLLQTLCQNLTTNSDAIDISLSGINTENNTFQLTAKISVSLLQVLIPINHQKFVGKLPTFTIESLVAYRENSLEPTKLMTFTVDHKPGIVGNAFVFEVTVSIQELSLLIMSAHKYYRLNSNIDGNQGTAMEESKSFMKLIFAGSDLNLTSRVLNVFRTELLLDRKTVEENVDAVSTVILKQNISEHSKVVHDFSVMVTSTANNLDVNACLTFNKRPIVGGPRVRLSWVPMSFRLCPTSSDLQLAPNLLNTILCGIVIKKGQVYLDLASQNPFALLHDGLVSIQTTFGLFSDTHDTQNSILAWRYIIDQWCFHEKFTHFRVIGTIGDGDSMEPKSRIDAKCCLPPRSEFFDLSKDNTWNNSSAQSALSDAISSIIQTQLRIVGFSDSTFRMLLELPSLGKWSIMPENRNRNHEVSFNFLLTVPKIVFNICSSELEKTATSQEPLRGGSTIHRVDPLKLCTDNSKCMAKVSIYPMELAFKIANGSFCDIETRLHDDLKNLSIKTEEGHVLPDALMADHHSHYSDAPHSALKNLVPISATVISLEEVINTFQNITQKKRWEFQISLAPIPIKSPLSLPTEKNDTVNKSEALYLNQFINSIGQMFPFPLPAVGPNRSVRGPLPGSIKGALVLTSRFRSVDNQNLFGCLQANFPVGHQFQYPVQSYGQSSSALAFLLNVQWGDTLITLKHKNSYISILFVQGQLGMRLADPHVNTTQNRNSNYFSEQLDMCIRMHVDDRDFNSTVLRHVLGMLIEAYKASAQNLESNITQNQYTADILQKLSTEELELSVTVHKYRPELENVIFAKQHATVSRTRFFDPRFDTNLESSLFSTDSKNHTLKTKLPIQPLFALIHRVNDRYQSGLSPVPQSIINAQKFVNEHPDRRFFAVVEVLEPTIPRFIQLPCILPLNCDFKQLKKTAEAFPKDSIPWFRGRITIFNLFQRYTSYIASLAARIIFKLNLPQYPEYIVVRLATNAIDFMFSVNDIDVIQVHMNKVRLERYAILPYTFPYYSIPPAHFKYNPPEVFVADVSLPRYYHEMVKIFTPLSIDPLCRISYDRKMTHPPLYTYQKQPQLMLNTPINMLFTNERSFMTNLTSTLLAGLFPETPLGAIPNRSAPGLSKIELQLEQVTDDGFFILIKNINIPNPSLRFALNIPERIQASYVYEGFEFIRVEPVSRPFIWKPGENVIDVKAVLSKTAFLENPQDVERIHRLFVQLLEGMLLGHEISIITKICIGNNLNLELPLYFRKTPAKYGSFDLSGNDPFRLSIDDIHTIVDIIIKSGLSSTVFRTKRSVNEDTIPTSSLHSCFVPELNVQAIKYKQKSILETFMKNSNQEGDLKSMYTPWTNDHTKPIEHKNTTLRLHLRSESLSPQSNMLSSLLSCLDSEKPDSDKKGASSTVEPPFEIEFVKAIFDTSLLYGRDIKEGKETKRQVKVQLPETPFKEMDHIELPPLVPSEGQKYELSKVKTGKSVNDVLTDIVYKISGSFRVLNPKLYELRLMSLFANFKFEEPEGANVGKFSTTKYGISKVTKFFKGTPSKGFSHVLNLGFSPSACKKQYMVDLLNTEYKPQSSIWSSASSKEPLYSESEAKFLQCAHNCPDEPSLTIKSSGQIDVDLSKLCYRSSKNVGSKGLYILSKLEYTGGVCVNVNRAVISGAFYDVKGKSFFTDLPISLPNLALIVDKYSDPCRLKSKCNPMTRNVPIERAWRSTVNGIDAHYDQNATYWIIQNAPSQHQMLRVTPLDMHASWEISFSFMVTDLKHTDKSKKQKDTKEPIPGFGFVLKSAKDTLSDSNSPPIFSRCSGDYGYGGCNDSVALLFDFVNNHLKYAVNGDVAGVHVKERGAFSHGFRNVKQKVWIRYNAGIEQLIVDVTDDDSALIKPENLGIVYHSVFQNVSIARQLGFHKAHIGFTVASNNFGFSISNWSIKQILPDFSLTRIFFFENRSTIPGALGFFAIKLSDLCDNLLMRAPGRLFVRLCKIEWSRMWSLDVDRLLNSPMSPTMENPGKIELATEKRKAAPIISKYTYCNVMLLADQGIYRASYLVDSPGRYSVEMYFMPFDQIYTTPNVDDNDYYLLRADGKDWEEIPGYEIYVRNPY